MPAIQSVRHLARKIPINLIRRAFYHSTPLKSHPKLSVARRVNLSSNDSKLLDCLVSGGLHYARRLLYEMPQRGHLSKVVTWTSLLSKFAKEGLVDEAQALFDILPERNVVTCNAMLSGYVQSGRLIEACGFFEAMREKNVVSWTSMLRGLMNSGELEEAKALFEKMPERNVVSWNTMIVGLVKNGDLVGARSVFNSMPNRDLVSLNTMIDGYVECGMMEEAKALFDQMEDTNVITCTTLISGYCRDEDVWSAYELFQRMPAKNVVSWTAMIGGFSWNGYFEEAISLFQEMKAESDVKPNVETFISLAYACAGVGFTRLCMQLHAHVVTNCSSYHDHDGRLSLGLIFMYAKCGLMEYAESVFLKNSMTRISQHGNIMINGYVQKGQLEKAKHIFDIMAVRDKISWTSMITGYFNVSKVAEACKLFNDMPETERDAIAWTAMISGFVQNEQFQEAMHLFSEMLMQGIMPLKAACSTLLGAAGATAQLDIGRHLHSLVIKTHTNFDPVLENSLISMYAKCGQISEAFQIFSNMTGKDSISWNSIIMGFSHHGLAREALSLFGDMIKSRVKPDSVTFLGILSACSHAGLIDEGWAVYRAMSDAYGIHPDVEHNICMINLLGRAGKVKEAENFVLSLPFNQDIAIWGALLGVCGVGEGNYEVASRTSQRLFELDPVNAQGHVVLCNMSASVGQYGEGGMLRKEMRSKGVRKAPGFSWVSSGERTRMFLSGDVTQIQGDAFASGIPYR
ncbi:pentatricopeptide repeat-containing protein At1g32415, mitochondrial-like [Silene latifolia]|uniref:pentatricopeptide repeat-containing protein At1g32415, mitochondrial-like n=1 Tax=Silene latifolia TaxID=37657 RepID=UPI003D78734A